MSDLPVHDYGTELREYIAEFLRTHADLELDEIPPEATLTEVNVDSLTVLSIIVLVEKKYGVEVSEQRAATARTFADLMDILGVPMGSVSRPS